MFTKKTLTAQNDKITHIHLPKDSGVVASLQYGAGGAGTIVLEGTLDEVTYIVIGLTPAGGGAVVANLAASGIGIANVTGYRAVRVNKTVAGVGGVDVTLGIVALR